MEICRFEHLDKEKGVIPRPKEQTGILKHSGNVNHLGQWDCGRRSFFEIARAYFHSLTIIRMNKSQRFQKPRN